MLKSYTEWTSLSQKGLLPCIIGLLGDERALIEEAILAVRKRVLCSGLADFNYDRVSAKAFSVASIINFANALPIMAEKRLVEVHEAESVDLADLELLEGYCRAPNPTTVLIFSFQSVDHRHKLLKLLDELGYGFKFEHPRLEQMPMIAINRARQHSLTLDLEVAQLIIMETGSSLLLLERALEKLALVAANGRVTPDDVAEQVSQMQLQDAFALARAVAVGDRVNAERFLAELELAHEVPLRLVGMLSWQLRQVLKARILLDRGLADRDIGRELSIYGDRLQPILNTARKWRKEIHVLRLSRLCQLDRELKSSRATSWLWLEKTVMQLCPATLSV